MSSARQASSQPGDTSLAVVPTHTVGRVKSRTSGVVPTFRNTEVCPLAPEDRIGEKSLTGAQSNRMLENMAPVATHLFVRRPSNRTDRTASRSEAAAINSAPRPGFVARASLVQGLVEASEAKLVVIVAPPGYGKSTLLSQWAEHEERRFVRMALSDQAVGRSGTIVTERSVLATASALGAEAGRFVLVLDDAHLIPDDVLRRVVDELMPQLTEGSTLAIASRTEPALQLGRLRAHQRLVEVRVDDLAMTPAEAATLLRGAGLELEFSAVQTLVRRSEGWPAALYLAAVSARGQDDAAAALAQLRGDDHGLAEYFRDEVLSALPQDLMDFAVRTSVLDELSAPACDHIVGHRGSGLVLSELVQASPLLQPLDRAHERYRWHRLIHDALRAQLRRTDRFTPAVLHARASSWYELRRDIEHAIDHAVAAHDCVRSGDLLWGAVLEYFTQGRNAIIQGWLAHFSPEELACYPPLALAAAYSFLAAGDAAQARHYAVAVAAAIDRDADGGRAAPLAAGLAGLEAMVAAGGVGGMAAASARACALEPCDGAWRPIFLFLHGTALHLGGDWEAGGRMLEEAADLSAARVPTVMSMCLAQAAMVAIEQRDWETASDLTDRAAEVIEEHGLTDYPICALAFAAAAAVRARDGRADEAKHDLRRGLELLATLGDFIPWYGAEARILLAHASLWLADVVGARTLLAEASRLARRTRGAVIFQQWFDGAWSYMDGLAETRLAGPSSLTIAELRILRFLPSHRSFREIAAQLGVSSNTVKTQAHAVYRKLGAASRSEAVGRALDAGLLGQ